MLEVKVKDMRQPDFSRGIEELTLPPNPRWSTHTRVQLPCSTKKQVITKNAPSPSPEWRASHRVQTSRLGAPINSKSSPRTSRSPRPARCRQTPRVTSSYPSLDLHSVGPSSSTLATLAKDEFFKVEAQTMYQIFSLLLKALSLLLKGGLRYSRCRRQFK